MATEAQKNASRLNGSRSKGPITDEGKAISRLNALEHGLAAVVVETTEDREQLARVREIWHQEFKPRDAIEEQLVDQIAIDLARIERCQTAFFANCRQYAERAQLDWDAGKTRQAKKIADKLHKRPSLYTTELESTLQGSRLKLDLWYALQDSLNTEKTWTDEQRSLALDLLGVDPLFRDGRTPLDPSNRDVFKTRNEVVEQEIDRLEDLSEHSLTRLDESEHRLALSSVGAEFSPQGMLLNRYENAIQRRRHANWRKLMELKASNPTPAPAPVSRPQPQPEPPPKPMIQKAPEVVPPPRPSPPQDTVVVKVQPHVALVESTTAAPQSKTPHPSGLSRRERKRLASQARKAG
jgi:hypothetical protein